MNLNIEANKFIFELEVGQGYNKVLVTKKTKKRIHFSNGDIVHIKTLDNGFFYLDSKLNSKGYPVINQILRDVEGFLVYKKLTKKEWI